MAADFVALDVETANADTASICQVGVAVYRDGAVAREWQSLVDPRDYFDGMNVSIHGITPEMVKGAPTYAELAPELHALIDGVVVVSHSHFDRLALYSACERWERWLPPCRWLDTLLVARRAWRDGQLPGYGLRTIAAWLQYDYKAHDALEDAKAAGQVLLAAMRDTGLDLDGWLDRVHRPVHSPQHTKITAEGNPNGPLFGEVLVFTGALEIQRRDAAAIAANLGCEVAAGVTKKTTMLVVGNRDKYGVPRTEKTGKERRAEELMRAGQPIRVLHESDFKRLADVAVLRPAGPVPAWEPVVRRPPE